MSEVKIYSPNVILVDGCARELVPNSKPAAGMHETISGKQWVVYTKPPFGGPEHVLQYLARYTHRVAISNHRLVSVDDNNVTFRWKDYAHQGRNRTMTLSHSEFLRRFLLHVLPKGFPRIRYFGWMATAGEAIRWPRRVYPGSIWLQSHR